MEAKDYDTIFEINKRKHEIINQINSIELHILENTNDVSYEQRARPLVFIISGVATGGKDLFIKYVTDYVDHDLQFLYNVYNLSSIDEVKRIADYMNKVDGSSEAALAISNKDDTYRTLLHNVKMAWSAFDDGPNHVIYNLINKIMDKHSKLVYNPSFIFVHVREAIEIDRMQKYLMESMGLIAISIGVIGHSDPNKFTNEGDALANNYDYDIIISNNGDIETLKETSYIFARNALTANQYYGI